MHFMVLVHVIQKDLEMGNLGLLKTLNNYLMRGLICTPTHAYQASGICLRIEKD